MQSVRLIALMRDMWADTRLSLGNLIDLNMTALEMDLSAMMENSA